MIKEFDKYNKMEEGLFWKSKKEKLIPEDRPQTKEEWIEKLKGPGFIDSINEFFNKSCNGREELFLKYFNILVSDKIIKTQQNEKFKGRKAILVKSWDMDNDRTTLQVMVSDDKGETHVLDAASRIEFALPKRTVNKLDPYGEENWE